MKLHSNLIDRLKRSSTSGSCLVYLNCAGCKFDFLGEKNQKLCAWCLAKCRPNIHATLAKHQ
jgi:hypothetical protein